MQLIFVWDIFVLDNVENILDNVENLHDNVENILDIVEKRKGLV